MIVKLDVVILSFCCLMYWVNYLDRMNLNNAYVSGMREDLNFKGRELNVINTSNTLFHDGCMRRETDHSQYSTVAMFSDRSQTTLPSRNCLLASTSRAALSSGD